MYKTRTQKEDTLNQSWCSVNSKYLNVKKIVLQFSVHKCDWRTLAMQLYILIFKLKSFFSQNHYINILDHIIHVVIDNLLISEISLETWSKCPPIPWSSFSTDSSFFSVFDCFPSKLWYLFVRVLLSLLTVSTSYLSFVSDTSLCSIFPMKINQKIFVQL